MVDDGSFCAIGRESGHEVGGDWNVAKGKDVPGSVILPVAWLEGCSTYIERREAGLDSGVGTSC